MRIKSLVAVLFALFSIIGAAEKANAGLFLSITIAPPALPVYVQPPIPGPGYMWTPGYWSWDEDVSDYYWVPGAWVPAPEPGLLWTPGYWGWNNGVYAWNAGYWGPHIGFYGGVSYGFGYGGVGFAGGEWRGGAFFYNRSVANIGGNTTIINNVYNKTVIINNRSTTSFNGGENGIRATPNAQELQAANEHHVEATKEQFNHQNLARSNPDLRASNNHGNPKIAAVSKAGDFHHATPSKSAGSPVTHAAFKPANAGSHQPGNAGAGNNHFDHVSRQATAPGGHQPGNTGRGNNHFDNVSKSASASGANANKGLNNKPKSPPKGPLTAKRPAPHPQPHTPPKKPNH